MEADARPLRIRIDEHFDRPEGGAHEAEILKADPPPHFAGMVAPMARHVDRRVGSSLDLEEFPEAHPPIAEQLVQRGGLEFSAEAKGERAAGIQGQVGFPGDAGQMQVAQL